MLMKFRINKHVDMCGAHTICAAQPAVAMNLRAGGVGGVDALFTQKNHRNNFTNQPVCFVLCCTILASVIIINIFSSVINMVLDSKNLQKSFVQGNKLLEKLLNPIQPLKPETFLLHYLRYICALVSVCRYFSPDHT